MKVTRRGARGGVATLAVAAVAVTVACGTGARKSTVRVAPTPNSEVGKTGPQVLADATNALAAVPALHFVASGPNPLTKKTVSIDMQAQADGGTATLMIDKGSVQLISIGSRTYFKGDVASLFGPLFGSLAGNIKKNPGGWYYSDDDSGEPTGIKSLAQEFAQRENGVTVEPTVAKGTLDGKPILIVRESDGSQLDVSAIGAPLPLKAIGSDGRNGVFGSWPTATFDYTGEPVQLRAPAGAIPLPDPSLDPNALASLLPSGFPSGFPSGLPTDFPSGFPTDFPSDLPSALESELQSFVGAHGGATAVPAPPTPTP